MSPGQLRFGRYDYATFLTYIAYAGCSVIVPVMLVEVAGALRFPLESGGRGAGGALQLGRSIPMVAAMLCCGFVAARRGKRVTIGLSVLLMGSGVMLSALAPSYWILFFTIALAGLGEGVVEALGTPVVQELHADHEPGRYVNFTHGFWSVGIVGIMLLAGAALYAGISWRPILFLTGAFALLPSLLFLLPDRHGSPFRTERAKAGIVWSRTGKIFGTGRFWSFFAMMFLAGGGEFGLTFWSASYIRLECGGGAFAGALGTVIFSVGMIVGRMGSALTVPQTKLFRLLAAASGAGVLFGAAQLFITALPGVYLILFLLGLASAPLWPSIQSYCVDRMPELDSTMVYVLLSCAGVPGCGVFTWLLGCVGDVAGLHRSFLLVPGGYLLLFILLVLDRWIHHHQIVAIKEKTT